MTYCSIHVNHRGTLSGGCLQSCCKKCLTLTFAFTSRLLFKGFFLLELCLNSWQMHMGLQGMVHSTATTAVWRPLVQPICHRLSFTLLDINKVQWHYNIMILYQHVHKPVPYVFICLPSRGLTPRRAALNLQWYRLTMMYIRALQEDLWRLPGTGATLMQHWFPCNITRCQVG